MEWLDFAVMKRKRNLPVPARDCGIVEGTVADGKVTRRIRFCPESAVSEEICLEELNFLSPYTPLAADALLLIQFPQRRFDTNPGAYHGSVTVIFEQTFCVSAVPLHEKILIEFGT